MREQFEKLLSDSVTAIASLNPLAATVERAAIAIRDCLLGGNKVLTCGNGGSAADAAHLATELVVRFQDDRPPYPAISLNDSGSTLTAASNDYGFDRVFERQIRALGKPGDVLVAFSTSGNSKSIQLAIETANQIGLTTISFLGKGGGACKGKASIELLVPSKLTARVQECHLVMYHAICTMIDADLNAGAREDQR